jgi:cell division septal protein FtsQ
LWLIIDFPAGENMWFDDDLNRQKKGRRRSKSSRRKPVLVLNARLKQRRREWGGRGGIIVVAIVSITAAAALGRVALLQTGSLLFANNQDFALTDLIIDCGENQQLKGYIGEQLGIELGTNLFLIDIEAVQANIEQTANVRRATVRRQLPGTLEISVVERAPVIRLGNRKDRHRYLVVDEEGAVFLARSRSFAKTRPVVTGYGRGQHMPRNKIRDKIDRALVLVETCRIARLDRALSIASIDLKKDHIEVGLRDGPEVLLAWTVTEGEAYPSDLEERLQYLAGIRKRRKDDGKPLFHVDLRHENYREYTPIRPL